MNFLLDRYRTKPIKMSQEQLNLLTLTAQYNKICAEYAKLANESKKDDEDDSGDECSSHPAYYCDGGCGKKVGDGNDDECKRYCVDCAIPDEEEEEDFWVADGGDIEVITAKPSEMDKYDEWGSFISFTDKRKK